MNDDTRTAWKTFTEEIEVAGQNLLSEINRLIAEGNVRKLVIKSVDGHVYLSIPLTAGTVAGGLVALSAPWLAILAAVAGLAAQLRIEIVRNVEPIEDGETETEHKGSAPPQDGPQA